MSLLRKMVWLIRSYTYPFELLSKKLMFVICMYSMYVCKYAVYLSHIVYYLIP